MAVEVSRRLRTLNALLRAGARHTKFVEPEIIGLPQLVAPGDVCLDIGGEFGLYAWTLAELVGHDGEVHCVEAQPALAWAINRNANALGARNVTVHSFALSDRAGLGHLSQPQRRGIPVHGRTFLADNTTGLGSNAEFNKHHEIEVEVDTLDDFVARLELDRLDFIKADIEGAEARLLAGGEQTLRRFTPTLLLELEDRHLERFDSTVAEVVAWLAELGYTPNHWQWDSKHRHKDGTWQPGIADRNVLFTLKT